MSAETVFGSLAIIFGGTMALAPLVQIRRFLVLRQAGDISQVYIWVIIAGVASFAADGIVTANWYIAIPNLISVFTNTGMLLLARHFVRRTDGRQSAAATRSPPT